MSISPIRMCRRMDTDTMVIAAMGRMALSETGISRVALNAMLLALPAATMLGLETRTAIFRSHPRLYLPVQVSV